MSTLRRDGSRRRLPLVLALVVAGCYEPCVFPPCISPLAVQVVVTADGSIAPVKDAFVREDAGIVTNNVPCTGSPARCEIRGYARTYNLEIGAPGFQTVKRSVVVSADKSSCGCPSATLERVEVSLEAATRGS
jgi:hypothetical protein